MMSETRKFYRTVYQFEVLSEEPMPDSVDLSQLDYEVTDGHCSGRFLETIFEEVDGTRMASLLQEQGSDPEFFMLDAEGHEIDEAA